MSASWEMTSAEIAGLEIEAAQAEVCAPLSVEVALAEPEQRFSLDEAIARATEVSNSLTGCSACAIAHEQLAGWLIELKALRRLIGKVQNT